MVLEIRKHRWVGPTIELSKIIWFNFYF